MANPDSSRLSAVGQFYRKNAQIISGIVFFVALLLFAFGFFVPIPMTVYLVAAIFLLQLLIEHVLRIERSEESPNRVFAEEVEGLTWVTGYIKNHSPEKVDMLEYSGSTVTNTFRELTKANAKIRLLVFDPRKVDDHMQRDMIEDSYRQKKWELANVRYDKEKNIEIAFYDTTPTLSGFCLDDQCVGVGWYLVEKSSKGEPVFTGHCNPFMICRSSTQEGAILTKFFKKHFDEIWTHRIPATEIEKWMNSQKRKAPF
jgi:uncharacterized membrane protein